MRGGKIQKLSPSTFLISKKQNMYFNISYLQAIIYIFLEILPFAMIVGVAFVFFFTILEFFWLLIFNK